MNYIKCYIGKSIIPNAGLGLFTAEDVKKGEIVWYNTPESEIIYTEEEFNNLPLRFKLNISKYVYKYKGVYHLNLDDSRHYNHSNTPNTEEDSLGNYIASRDITKDEELTCNYFDFNDDSTWIDTLNIKFS